MTVADFIALTRRGLLTLVIAVLVGLLAAGAWFAVTPRVYQASASGFIAPGNADVIGSSDAAVSRAQSYLPLITSTRVREIIAADPVANPSGAPVTGGLSASLALGSNMIVVRANSSSPDSALALANGALTALASVIEELESQSGSARNPLQVIPFEDASLPSAPVSPNWRVMLPLGAAGGLFVGYIVLFIRRALKAGVRNGDEISASMGAGLLGGVPLLSGRSRKTARIIGQDEPIAAESIRQIRTSLRFSSVDRDIRSFVVTSANPSEGKSTITASLAKAFADSGQPTVVIDADLRRSAISPLFDAQAEIGLSELLTGQVSADDAIRPTEIERLWLLPSGRRPPNPAEIVGSKAFEQLIAGLSKQYLVIVDAPPVLPVTDAVLAAAATDGVVFVTASSKTKRSELAAAKLILDRVHTPMLGVVLNMTRATDGEGGHYSYYGKNYYGQKGGRGKKETPSTDKAVVLEQADVNEGRQAQAAPLEPMLRRARRSQ